MSAIQPTNNTGLIVDEFIKYATEHLKTVQGVIVTTSLYQLGPATVALPGQINWTGYFVQPAKPSQPQLNEDDFPAKENVDSQESQPQTNELTNGVTEEEIDKKIKMASNDEDFIDFDAPVTNTRDVIKEYKFTDGKPFVSGFKAGGFTAGFNGATSVDLGPLNFGADWVTLAAQFIGKNEGFAARASWDYNAYRLGFGSDKILGADGRVRDVLPPASYYKQTGEKQPANGDTTTVDAALKMLQYEIAGPYKSRLVGTGTTKISEAAFNTLNNKQRAALVSFVYNCGSLKPAIAAAINGGNLSLAAQLIAAGPITAGGEVLPGLVRRRKEEATLFST
jgi:GH24 family phage-related lysozyme (muramidase)